jgi:uncharacterized protein (DUF1778 family)
MSLENPVRKDHHRLQTAPVLLRLEPEHHELVTAAAKRAGLPRVAWIRSKIIQAAREELGK